MLYTARDLDEIKIPSPNHICLIPSHATLIQYFTLLVIDSLVYLQEAQII